MTTTVSDAYKVKEQIRHKGEELGWLVRKDAAFFIDNDMCLEILKQIQDIDDMVRSAYESYGMDKDG